MRETCAVMTNYLLSERMKRRPTAEPRMISGGGVMRLEKEFREALVEDEVRLASLEKLVRGMKKRLDELEERVEKLEGRE